MDHQIIQKCLYGVLESLELSLQQAESAYMGYLDFF